MIGAAQYKNAHVPQRIPRGVATVTVGGGRYDAVATALYRTITRHGRTEDHEQLHRDALHFGYCLVDGTGRRVSPEEPTGAARAITYAIGRD
jgi:hypothetical protein